MKVDNSWTHLKWKLPKVMVFEVEVAKGLVFKVRVAKVLLDVFLMWVTSPSLPHVITTLSLHSFRRAWGVFFIICVLNDLRMWVLWIRNEVLLTLGSLGQGVTRSYHVIHLFIYFVSSRSCSQLSPSYSRHWGLCVFILLSTYSVVANIHSLAHFAVSR